MPEVKQQPTPGFDYIVQRGQSDYISNISARAYGDYSNWPLIRDANREQVKGPDKESGGDQVWFLPGQRIFIPVIAGSKKKIKEKLSGKETDEETLIVDGVEIKLMSFTFTRAIDTGSNYLKCDFAWEPGKDVDLDRVTQFYLYPEALFYIGGELRLSGLVYDVTKKSEKSGRSITLEIYTRTADFIDSTVNPPYEKNNTLLLDEIKRQAKPFGINVLVGENVDLGGQIDRVTASKTDKRFDYCAKLCSERGVLLSCTDDGDLNLIVADVDAVPVGTIQEKLPPAQSYEFKSKGRGRFNYYRAVSQKPAKNGGAIIVKDENVPRGRTVTFTTDVRYAELQKAGEWKKNKALADDLSIPFPVDSWYAPDGTTWNPNTKVSVESVTLGIEKGFTFLIKSVDLIKDKSGKTGVINLVPPEVYTKAEINEPWRKD